MKIKWKNVAAFVLLLPGLILGLIFWSRWYDSIRNSLSHIAQSTPENETANRMFSLIVLALICLTFVCTVRLLRNR